MDNIKRSVFKFTNSFFCLFEPVNETLCCIFFFISLTVYFTSKMFLWFLLFEPLILLLHYFPKFILFSVYFQISLPFLKIIVLKSFSGNSQISISLGLITWKLSSTFGGVVFPYFTSLCLCINVCSFERGVTSSSLLDWFWWGKTQQKVALRVLAE